MSPARIVFMGSAAFAVPSLAGIVREGYQVVSVVTQPDKPSGRGQHLHQPPVKMRAVELGLAVYQPPTLKDPAVREHLGALAADLYVVVAYGKILPGWLLDLPRHGAINLHGSLLPSYRGAAPINWAIIRGDSETGVCTMKIDEGLDTGPVYACIRTSIGDEETAPELSQRLATMGGGLLLRTMSAVLAGEGVPVAQEHSRATAAPMLRKEHGFITWAETAMEIHNRIRGLLPWPAVTVRFRGVACRLLRTRAVSGGNPAPPGALSSSKEGLRVCCGDGGWLEILEIQPENRRSVSGRDFANGFRVASGEQLLSMVAENG